MGDRSKIEWTEATWNPLIGCSKVSPGCDHCYAVGVVHRGMSPQHVGLTVKPDGAPTDWTGEVRFVPSVLDKPLRWKRPRRVFVNSLSDLFHPGVGDETIAQIFAVMALTPQHTYQVLTKRPQRMAAWVNDTFGMDTQADWVAQAATHVTRKLGWDRPVVYDGRVGGPAGERLSRDRNYERRQFPGWPLPNVCLGTSIESDRYAFRADHLRRTPAAVRWISAEPLLGPLPSLDLTGIDWLVVGGESGPGARPMHPEWVRELRDRCLSPGITRIVESHHGAARATTVDRGPAFFFKQWGDWAPSENDDVHYGEFHDGEDWVDDCICSAGDGPLYRVGKKAAGRELDGRTWDEYPT